jgi:hypothetical protein
MGKEWDDLPPGVEWAAECLRVLRPGGYLLAFGGTRTFHRLACAVEDAGFEIRDSIAWLYGSGFPKSLDVGKAIDKAAGAQREVIGVDESVRARKPSVAAHAVAPGGVYRWGDEHYTWDDLPDAGKAYVTGRVASAGEITAPATPAAREWAGWGTALKPAFEPVVVARKPLVGSVAGNVQEWGCGALNIDATRVNPGSPVAGGGGWAAHKVDETEGWDRPYVNGVGKTEGHSAGRWPANVVLDGSQADVLDQQSGPLATQDHTKLTNTSSATGSLGFSTGRAARYPDVVGTGASRFFPTFRYQAKAPTSERPTYTTTDGRKVAHPTVKPLGLMRWLVRLVTPPSGTVLDPFAGSGATVEACLIEGFDCIAIERDPESLPLIQIRIDRQAGTLPFEDVS